MIEKTVRRFFKTDLKARLYGNAFWSLAGAVLSKLIFFIALIVAANILGKVHYGEFGMMNSTVLMFVALASLGLGATASRYIAEFRDTDPEKTINVYLVTQTFSYVVGFISSVIIFWFADSISVHSFHSNHLGDEIRIGTVIFFFSIINGAQNGVLSGFERFDLIAYSNVVKAVFQSVLLIAGAYYYRLFGALAGLAIAQLAANLYNRILIAPLLKAYRIRLLDQLKKLSFRQFDILWKFSLPTVISSLAIVPVMWYAKTKLVQLEGFKTMANFDVAEQWRAQILYIPAVLSQIVLPMLSNFKGNASKEEYFKSIRINLSINVVVSFVLSLFVILIAPWLLSKYGKDFNNTVPVYFLCISAVLIAASNVVFPILLTYNKIWYGMLINGIWALCFVLLSNELLNRGYGEDGLAAAVAISYAFMLLVQGTYCWYLIKNKEWNEI